MLVAVLRHKFAVAWIGVLSLCAADAQEHSLKAATDVAQLYELLREINGDEDQGPIFCFPKGVSTLDADAWKNKNRYRREKIFARIRDLRNSLAQARRASGNPILIVRVIGHADNKDGKPRANIELAYRRARSIAARLSPTGLWVVAEGRIDQTGYSETGCLPIKGAEASPNRKVEIEISATSLTHVTYRESQERLRLYKQATMPGRLQSFVLLEANVSNAFNADGTFANIGQNCSMGNLNGSFRKLPSRDSPMEALSGSLYIRLRAYLLRQHGPVIKARIVLDVATSTTGRGIPDYWAMQQRLEMAFDGTPLPDQADWNALQACSEKLGKKKLVLEPDPRVLAKILDDAPKDLHGIMLHAHRLDRDLHFFDLQPGMGITYQAVTSEYADGSNPSAFPGGPFEFATRPDPIDPCAAVPRPRRFSPLDNASPLANPADVTVSNPFLAYMLSGRGVGRGMCEFSGPTSEAQVLSLVTPDVSWDGGNRLRVPHWTPLASHIALEAFLQSGVVRVFVPQQLVPTSFILSSIDYDGAATILVAAPSRERLDQFAAMKVGNALRIYEACSEAVSLPDIGCGFLVGGATFSPSVTMQVKGRTAQHYLGTRVTHVVDPKVSAPCFKDGSGSDGDWPETARLKGEVTLSIGTTTPQLMDRRDCRLLGVILPNESSVSW